MGKMERSDLPNLFSQYATQLRDYDRDFLKLFNSFTTKLYALMNKGLTFDDNMDVYASSYTSNAVAGTEDTVAHSLGRVPTGYIVVSIDKAGVVYKGPTAWTNANIYLKCSAASAAVMLLVF